MKKKVSEVKKEIGYVNQSPRCANCRHYSKTTEEKIIGYMYRYEHVTIHHKCELYNFATKPNAFCKKWEPIVKNA